MKVKSPNEPYRHPKGSPVANWLRAIVADMLGLAEVLPDPNSQLG